MFLYILDIHFLPNSFLSIVIKNLMLGFLTNNHRELNAVVFRHFGALYIVWQVWRRCTTTDRFGRNHLKSKSAWSIVFSWNVWRPLEISQLCLYWHNILKTIQVENGFPAFVWAGSSWDWNVPNKCRSCLITSFFVPLEIIVTEISNSPSVAVVPQAVRELPLLVH